MYRGHCCCDQNFIGGTVNNAKIRWNEHEDENSEFEPAKHLKANPNHKFTWTIISKASDYYCKCRVS